MAIHKIADTTLRTLKVGANSLEGKKRLHDGGGLYLLLEVKGGGRAWRFDYTFAGRRKTISLGIFPDTSLKLAREKAKDAREKLAAGIDPSEARQAAKSAERSQREAEKRHAAGMPAADSFEAVVMEWHEKHIAPKSASHSSRSLAYLKNDLIPYLGRQPIAEIKAPALLECLRRIAARKNKQGKPITETANRVREQMGQLWRYAIATGRAEHDIAADLRGALAPHVQKNFSHITDPKLLGQLMRDVEAYGGAEVTVAALRLLPLVFVRPGEFRAARWQDIDLEAGEWRYFSPKTKVDHIVPLASQVVAQLRKLQPQTGTGEYVFGVRAGLRPLSEGTINQALKAIGYSSEIIQPHGFRHTAATMLAELGWDENMIDRQLSHKVPGIKGVYQKSKYLDERHKMMQAWADYLDRLKEAAMPAPSLNSWGD